MADYTKSGGMSTAKARRKDPAARNTEHGLATRGRTKRTSDPPPALTALVPEARDTQARAAGATWPAPPRGGTRQP
jgi:hypothetical protein